MQSATNSLFFLPLYNNPNFRSWSHRINDQPLVLLIRQKMTLIRSGRTRSKTQNLNRFLKTLIPDRSVSRESGLSHLLLSLNIVWVKVRVKKCVGWAWVISYLSSLKVKFSVKEYTIPWTRDSLGLIFIAPPDIQLDSILTIWSVLSLSINRLFHTLIWTL